MKNRDSAFPGRIKLTPVDEANGIYDLTRADEPRDPGTPLNKKLLDFAVAACGVTAGTATAYTLDDEFGGFELVDGAKVNFRLHVASGVNPTLNVNGTGAKEVVSATGRPITSGLKAGTWFTATYSEAKDAYETTVATIERWITETDAAASQIEIELPSGFTKYHIKVWLSPVPVSGTNSYREIYLGSDVILNWMFGGVSNSAFVQKTVSANTEASTGVAAEKLYGGGIDLLVIIRGTTTRISGTVSGARGIAGVNAYANSNALGTLKIYFTNSASIAAGATIIMEGIRE